MFLFSFVGFFKHRRQSFRRGEQVLLTGNVIDNSDCRLSEKNLVFSVVMQIVLIFFSIVM